MIGPQWLVDDIQRVEELLVGTAGASHHPLVSEPALHLLKAGGKRLRPMLVLITSRAGRPGATATDLAAGAVELVHLATLYHDDVIDEAETRRGVPTTHSKWGTEIAVLAGDYLFACGCALGAEAGGEVPGILARAIAEVCEGQIVETAALGDARRPVDDYLATIEKKTAALFKAACDLGGATSGAGHPERAALLAYGQNLGMAFQVVDDLLDLLGDPEVIGKPPGTDLKAGVFTAPVLVACTREPRLAERLQAGSRELGDVLPVLEASGAIDDGFQLATSYADAACNALERLPEGEWRAALHMVVDSVLAQLP